MAIAFDETYEIRPQVRRVEGDDTYGKFEIQPLEPGFGTTLGNTLRRVLLSSLPGAAITSIQIEGVAHEFTAIPHVKEDVTELILNLKQVSLRCHSLEPATVQLDVKGPAEVTAADIRPNADVEVVNPELYLCTVAKGGHLRIDLTVERGKGFVSADRTRRDDQPIGSIPIDAIFSPVRRANFVVEKTRVGQSTDYDRLNLEVWTDGTINPEEAVSTAASLFTKHLGLFVRFGDSINENSIELAPGTGSPVRADLAPIEELDLSVRAYNCLKANDINTVGQLLAKRESELLSMRNFGKKSLDEIKLALVEKGFIAPENMEDAFLP